MPEMRAYFISSNINISQLIKWQNTICKQDTKTLVILVLEYRIITCEKTKVSSI